jgi:hypothetical protein
MLAAIFLDKHVVGLAKPILTENPDLAGACTAIHRIKIFNGYTSINACMPLYENDMQL